MSLSVVRQSLGTTPFGRCLYSGFNFGHFARRNPIFHNLRSISSSSTEVKKEVKKINKNYPDLADTDLTSEGVPDYVKLILTSRVYDVVDETPVTYAVSLSQRTGANVMLKREDQQPVFSFKLRGAYNMMAKLPADQKAKGVIACSAGNHAQGVAYSAKHLGIPATIVMPVATPSIKYQNVSRLGSQVVLYGDDFDGAKSECERLTIEKSLTNIPPFDHPYVIAGQGTIAMELLRQINSDKIKAVFCAIGGGGLISGIGAYLKRLAPHIKIIGVETFDADAMKQGLDKGENVTLNEIGNFADGTAVKHPGTETFRVCQKVVDEVILVNTDEICAAIKDVFEDTRTITEPSGAMTVAGMKKYVTIHPELDHSDATYIPVLSGANMNFDRLRFVAERAKLGEGKEVFMIVSIPDKPGTFLQLHSIINPRAVTEFSYRFNSSSRSGQAHIYMSFSVRDPKKEISQVVSELEKNGFGAKDISDNEMAKSHGRYMVGGSTTLPNERLLRFEFPERPGALAKFLNGVQNQWNITLFHYRNHGSDISSVLTGLAVPPEDNEKFQEFVDSLAYKYVDETDNLIYKMLMRD